MRAFRYVDGAMVPCEDKGPSFPELDHGPPRADSRKQTKHSTILRDATQVRLVEGYPFHDGNGGTVRVYLSRGEEPRYEHDLALGRALGENRTAP